MTSMKLLIVTAFVLSNQFVSARTNQQIVSYYECATNELSVVVNHKNKSAKKDIVLGMQALTSYSDLVVTPVYSPGSELKFTIRSANCEVVDGAQVCNQPASWNEIQWRLKTVTGVEVKCNESNAPEAAAAQDSKADARGGGVTGQNGG